jgi:hopene-associated glycosyltransferase HpnB
MMLHPPTWLAATVPLLWFYLVFLRGTFWRVTLPQPRITTAKQTRTAAIVPARNEADVIARAISSLLAQRNVNLNIYVVDDASHDDTADVAHQAASGSTRLTVIRGKPLPEGWSGKLWAMQEGVEAASASAPDYFLFTDADIEHDPENISALLSIAEEGPYDLASFMVKLHCNTAPEKLLIPAFVYFFFKLYPPRWISDPKRATAGAAGGCILIRREALSRLGGLERIRHELIDDCSLAREVKRSGGKLWLGLTQSAHSIRPYESFAAVERMISRTAFNQLKHSSLLLAVSILALLLTYIAPIAFLFTSSTPIALCGALGFALMMTAYAPMVRFYRLNMLWTLTLPAAAIFYMCATLHSAWKYWFGRGGQWKGRAQDRTQPETSHAR